MSEMSRRNGVIALACAATALSLWLAPGVASAASTTGDFDGDGFADLAVGVPREDGGAGGSIADSGAVNVLYGTASGLAAGGNQVWEQDTPGIADAEVAEAGDRFGATVGAGDFDQDGFADLAVGAPGEDLGSAADAGAVHIIPGSFFGLSPGHDQFWHQDSAGIINAAATGDAFGSSLAAADLVGIPYTDLAVGVPGEDLGSAGEAGAVNIIPGFPTGLSPSGDQFWHQDSNGIMETAEQGDGFGTAVTTADFDGDGFPDLAAGVPFEDLGAGTSAGAVNLIYASDAGLAAAGDQVWHQDVAGIGEQAGSGDGFGSTLDAADFDGDSFADLASGVPFEDLGSVGNAGAVNLIYGSGAGLAAADDQIWHQDVSGIAEAAETGDGFGTSLAAADFDGGGTDDLVIGAYGETVGAVQGGMTHVLYSDLSGLATTGSQIWHQDLAGILDQVETNDRYGFSLTAGDFNGSGSFDLAIGVPGENIAGAFSGGAAVLYSGRDVAELGSSRNQLWHQNSVGIGEAAEANDSFGHSLASGAPVAP